jgi:hypothetical protein
LGSRDGVLAFGETPFDFDGQEETDYLGDFCMLINVLVTFAPTPTPILRSGKRIRSQKNEETTSPLC